MPLFEFVCNSCDRKYEELLFSSSATAPCPACGSDEVTRLLSTFASNAVKGDKCGGCKPKSGLG